MITIDTVIIGILLAPCASVMLYLFVRVASAAWFKSKAQSQTTQEK